MAASSLEREEQLADLAEGGPAAVKSTLRRCPRGAAITCVLTSNGAAVMHHRPRETILSVIRGA